MDEMLPFLRAIAANPGDDAPRLVFADWLDEHEQPGRAEFIRLQIELARTDPAADGYAEKTARMRRCGVLTGKGKHRFFDHLPTKKLKIAFRRGFIEAIDTADADRIDTSGFDLVPLLALRTGAKHVGKFTGFTQLKWLEYNEGRNAKPAKLLDLLGPGGPFKNLEELSLPDLTTDHLEAGVIPKFDLPKLRNFYLSTCEFSHLGLRAPRDEDEDDEEDYGRGFPWGGVPDYLPRNALPNPKSPLERFVWHGDDDSDLFGEDEGWEWRGPTMESLLAHLKTHNLKQIEVATDYDDHENGGEGIRTAPYKQNPLELAPTLERVSVSGDDMRLLSGARGRLKELRVYEAEGALESLFALLNQPICSELEALTIDERSGWWSAPPAGPPAVNLPKLKSLRLGWGALERLPNCQFPNLISLSGTLDVKTVLERKWPKLQHLDVHVRSDSFSELKSLVQSDCCPNLTTLTVGGYYPQEADLSFLADCPHMPFFSLVRFPEYPWNRNYIVADGALVPARDDVLLDGLTPSMPYRFSVAF